MPSQALARVCKMCTMTSTLFRPWNKPRQRLLFEEKVSEVPAVHLPAEIQKDLRQALTHWMQQVSRSTPKEGGDE